MPRTLTIQVTRSAADAPVLGYGDDRRIFGQPEQLLRVFTPTRWSVVEVLQQQSVAIGLRPLARLLDRDPTAVLRDLTALSDEGVIEQDEHKKWHCPFSVIQAVFTLERGQERDLSTEPIAAVNRGRS